jgi:hypothetical protein
MKEEPSTAPLTSVRKMLLAYLFWPLTISM